MRFIDQFIGHDPSPQFNSHGHRCKELNELNFQNYLLFLGDNPSLGLHKPIEETFPYIVANKLNIDYYNLAVFNGGVDALRYNLLMWLHRFNKRPRAIIVSCEFLNSVLISDSSFSYLKTCDFSRDYTHDLLDAAERIGFFKFRNHLADLMISRMINIPIYQINFKDRHSIFSAKVININHDGDIHDYESIANLTINEIKNIATKVKP
jgi:hypothetical protein